jgi:hypothetical protein
MTRITFIALPLLLLGACASAPTQQTTAAADCSAIAASIAQTEQERRDALEQGDSAWKAVVPFAVLARKAKARSAVEQADARLVELQAASGRQGCSRPTA